MAVKRARPADGASNDADAMPSNGSDAPSTAPKTVQRLVPARTPNKRKWKESWMTERGGVEHERQLWLYYEAATGTMNCKACILFDAKRGNIMVDWW